MKKLLYLFLAVSFACSSGDDSTTPDNNDPQNNDPNNNVPPTCDVVYLDANGVTIKACPDAQVGESGEVNGVTYTIVSPQELRDYVNSGYLELNRLVTTQVVYMTNLFMGKKDFNQDISSWDVSNVINMENMFWGTSFNQDISNWDVSNVTDMSNMFYYADSFNQPIGNWDVSNVTDMRVMFYYAESFNQPIGNWDVSNVTDLAGMFYYAHSFNQPIGNWDVSNVTDMILMFADAVSFNQDLSEWDVVNVELCENFDVGTFSWTLPKPNFTNCTP